MNMRDILESTESDRLEFKEKFGDSVLKAISAFSNTEGGCVVIGVSDNKVIRGIEYSNRKLEEIADGIIGKLGIHPRIKVEKHGGKKVLIIEAPKSPVLIPFKGRYYKRVGNTTREMKPDELKSFLLRETKWDAQKVDCSIEEIDRETVMNFLRLAGRSGRLIAMDESAGISEVLERLKLLAGEKLTNGAVMLFGTDPQERFINAALRITRLKGSATIVGDRTIGGNLFKQVIEGEEAIKNFINVRYEIQGLQREEIWDYPLPAIREALLNALIHRDYFRWNVQIQIKIFDDSIWFFNVGGLPEGMTVEKLKATHASFPRNPLIAHVFYLAGFIEEIGTGIERMTKSLTSSGLPEPEFLEEMGGLSVRFRKDIHTMEHLKKIGLNERQIKAAVYVKEKGKITNKGYQEICETSERTASRDLSSLVSTGIFEQIGATGRGTAYILSGRKEDKDATKTPQRRHKGLGGV